MRQERPYHIVPPASRDIDRRTSHAMSNAVSVGVLIVMEIVAVGVSMSLQGKTLADWRIPCVLCLVLSLVAAVPANRLVNLIGRRIMNYLLFALILFPFLLCGFYSLNYYASDSGSRYEFTGKVTGKYSQERYRTRRAGTRSVRGEKYTAYCIVIETPDGKSKHKELSAGEYIGIRRGGRMRMDIETGLFGIPVIKNGPEPVRNSVSP